MKKLLLLTLCLWFGGFSFAQKNALLHLSKTPELAARGLLHTGPNPRVGRIVVPGRYQLGEFSKGIVRGKVLSVPALKAKYLREQYGLTPATPSELLKGGATRRVRVDGAFIPGAFTLDGDKWFFSQEAAQAINDGIIVVPQKDGSILFSVDATIPSFDFYDYSVMSEARALRNLGFSLRENGMYLTVSLPERTSASQTYVFLGKDAEKPTLMANVPAGTFVTMSMRKFLVGAENVPYPDLIVGRRAKAKPEEADWDLWTNHLMGYMMEARLAYMSLQELIEKLGSYKDAVDIIWVNVDGWMLRDTEGKMYHAFEVEKLLADLQK